VTTIHQTYTCLSRDAVLDKVAFGLLRCHPLISAESAVTFYQSNTFYFGGDEVWSPLYRFLKDIGSNRVLLRNVSIEMAELYKGLHQDQYGARILTHHGSPALFSPVYSSSHPLVLGPSSLLVSPPSNTPRSLPDHYRTAHPIFEEDWGAYRLPYFDPAIQACFRLLGSSESQLTLCLIRTPSVPGMDKGGLAPSLELANFIEALRQGFAEKVTVLWNCQVVGPRDFLAKEANSIQSKGWEIVKAKLEPPRVFPGISREPSIVDSSFYITHLVLRRRLVDQILLSFCESCSVFSVV
jgi:hypothetical protein